MLYFAAHLRTACNMELNNFRVKFMLKEFQFVMSLKNWARLFKTNDVVS